MTWEENRREMGSREKELAKMIRYWEGLLQGIRAGLNVEVAEVWLKLPVEAQRQAFEILKEKEREPFAWEIVGRFINGMVIPLIEIFIADLRLLLTLKERGVTRGRPSERGENDCLHS